MSAIHLKVPTSWQEMTQGQLEYFCRKSLMNHDATAVKSLCLIEFAGLKLTKKFLPDLYEFKRGRVRFTLDADRFAHMLYQLNFLDEAPGLFNPPARIKSCDAADSRLYGLRLDQWFVADNLYAAYANTKDTTYLDKLIAVFYTQYGEAWNNGDDLSRRSLRFSKVPLHVKQVVFLWYTGVKLWLMQKYYYVFAGGDGGSETPADEVIMGVLRSLNGGHVSNNDKVKATEMHECLFELNKLIEESKNPKQHV